MTDEYRNSRELRDFVEKHHLRSNNSIIHFNAIVTISTAKDKKTNLESEVMVNFDEHGSLSLFRIEVELDPMLYPSVFNAKWQSMSHVDGEYLLISGMHSTNSDIGKYTAKIHPRKRLRA